MDARVKLNELAAVLSELEYPIDREDVVDRCSDVTLELSDGEENLGEVVAGSTQDTFDSSDELSNEVMNLLPQHAVGEPYQSEGEG